MSAILVIEGADKLIAKLGKAAAMERLNRPMQRAVMRLHRDMAEYPPQRPNSRYIRGWGYPGGKRTSERLGQRWTTEVKRTANGLDGRVGNNASYAPYVQHDRRFPAPHQALIHVGRWQTDAQVMNRNARAITDDFQDEIEKALRG